ncbi:C-X-C motif chemokine 16 [Talpa occidentalis]|uniref:C-X-C motif chemokine 16 n=1 Tax=Talpa occidentalis TaxID=50954 RepID=UPI00188FA1E8|nr:C-X-C motif chemokine 16 [Talpa occidentalis]
MWRAGVPQFRVLLLLLLALLTLPGYGNEGSGVGSCPCNSRVPSKSPPTAQKLEHFRKHLEGYLRCVRVVRFQFLFGTRRQRTSVCGGSKDPWVSELINCFERKECGLAYFGNMAHQKRLHPSTAQGPESTERTPLNISTPVQMYLPPTLQPTLQPSLLAETPSLDKKLTYSNETIDSSLETRDSQKQDKVRSAVLVPVLSLLVITFILTSVLTYVLCKRRQQSLQKYPGLEFDYAHVTPDFNT